MEMELRREHPPTLQQRRLRSNYSGIGWGDLPLLWETPQLLSSTARRDPAIGWGARKRQQSPLKISNIAISLAGAQ